MVVSLAIKSMSARPGAIIDTVFHERRALQNTYRTTIWHMFTEMLHMCLDVEQDDNVSVPGSACGDTSRITRSATKGRYQILGAGRT